MIANRATNDLLTLARSAFPDVDFFVLYGAKVESCDEANKTVDVTPADTRIPSMSKIPLRFGVPGVVADVAAGSRVLVGWDGGDPSLPFAMTFSSDSSSEVKVTADAIKLNNGTNGAVRIGDHGAGGTLTLTVGGGATLAWTYKDPDNVETAGASGSPITLKTKATEGSSTVKIG